MPQLIVDVPEDKNVNVDAADQWTRRRTLFDQFLGERFSVDTILERRRLGVVSHLFSHIRQTMFVELIDVSRDALASLDDDQQVRVLSCADAQKTAISKGNLKALALWRAVERATSFDK